MSLNHLLKLSILFILLRTSSGLIAQQTQDLKDLKDLPNITFFTNRPIVEDAPSLEFENKWNQSTRKLYFVSYDPDSLNYEIQFQLEYNSDMSDAAFYAQHDVLDSVFAQVYSRLGFKEVVVVVPGYAKKMSNLTEVFMPKLERMYRDRIDHKVLFITYAWANEWNVLRYQKARKSAKRSATDFAIFQILMQHWFKDLDRSQYPDFRLGLITLSMGNQLMKYYIKRSEELDYVVAQTYDYNIMLGADVSWNSFRKGRGLDRIQELSKSTLLFVNKKDKPLGISGMLTWRRRLGRHGPKVPGNLPESVLVYNATEVVKMSDGGLQHDYFFRNEVIRNGLIEAFNRSYTENE